MTAKHALIPSTHTLKTNSARKTALKTYSWSWAIQTFSNLIQFILARLDFQFFNSKESELISLLFVFLFE
jgi:hypothetical protein